jgi:mannose-6-phosphate isomerase-like protein (cupin superfamily)
MLIVDSNKCKHLVAQDGTVLCDILSPHYVSNQINFSVAHVLLDPFKSSKSHKLGVTESYYIIKGKGILHIDEEHAHVTPGQIIFIPKNAVQYIENTGKEVLEFLCICNPEWSVVIDELVE